MKVKKIITSNNEISVWENGNYVVKKDNLYNLYNNQDELILEKFSLIAPFPFGYYKVVDKSQLQEYTTLLNKDNVPIKIVCGDFIVFDDNYYAVYDRHLDKTCLYSFDETLVKSWTGDVINKILYFKKGFYIFENILFHHFTKKYTLNNNDSVIILDNIDGYIINKDNDYCELYNQFNKLIDSGYRIVQTKNIISVYKNNPNTEREIYAVYSKDLYFLGYFDDVKDTKHSFYNLTKKETPFSKACNCLFDSNHKKITSQLPKEITIYDSGYYEIHNKEKDIVTYFSPNHKQVHYNIDGFFSEIINSGYIYVNMNDFYRLYHNPNSMLLNDDEIHIIEDGFFSYLGYTPSGSERKNCVLYNSSYEKIDSAMYIKPLNDGFYLKKEKPNHTSLHHITSKKTLLKSREIEQISNNKFIIRDFDKKNNFITALYSIINT